MTTTDEQWWATLRALDEPVAPPSYPMPSSDVILGLLSGTPGALDSAKSFLDLVRQEQADRHARGEGDLTVPRGFDRAAAQARFDRLATLLGECFGEGCAVGSGSDACFGSVMVPAGLTRTRTKRSRVPVELYVSVSSFGDLATYAPGSSEDPAPVHAEDRRRIDSALAEAGYVTVPRQVLDARYDGPNTWALGEASTWYVRFFDLI
ncbi:hypothetical protein [Catellatospora methionotrophica]|uniref:hypothetical protein n=1 Tax=Catellatospora methionotrophica TaxID=121620 RepID=UPI0033F5E3CD